MKYPIDNRTIHICSKAFANHPTYAEADRAINMLVDAMPRNDILEAVLLKVVSIKTLYATQIYQAFRMAEHVVKIVGLDDALRNGSVKPIFYSLRGYGLEKLRISL